ncbi:hypothetical protein F5984_24330 [Rudanella paleaurantiibacter]|jgi:hypothetical protein|uniref:Uncharacterized protein n=1 Tax=Rudanella paleaurantiibacter TaxID=2614655 RepID=A0A7J5TSI8_9BACT|nr:MULTISPECIES: hypothetical protein [Rudanella]KAB7726451.1 hypothetical protein F5984_24330 [Rudanella paleaurantiibacter]
MCNNLFTRTQDVWLFGNSANSIWPSLSTPDQGDSAWRPRQVMDWETFWRRASKVNCILPKRLVLLADASALSHEIIFQIQQYRAQNALFSPVIHFDKPDLCKFIHTFNSDLAGYCAATDTNEEMGRLLRAVCAGKHYYSPGFCQMVEDLGFPIARGDDDEYIKN